MAHIKQRNSFLHVEKTAQVIIEHILRGEKHTIQIDLWSVTAIRLNYARRDSATVSVHSVTSA